MIDFVSKADTKKLKYIGLSSLGQICYCPDAGDVHNGSADRMCLIHVLIQIFLGLFFSWEVLL